MEIILCSYFYTADPWGEQFLLAEGERESSEKNNYTDLQRADKGKPELGWENSRRFTAFIKSIIGFQIHIFLLS